MKLKYTIGLVALLVIAGIVRRWLFPPFPEWVQITSAAIFVIGIVAFVIYARRRQREFEERLNRRVDPGLYDATSNRTDSMS